MKKLLTADEVAELLSVDRSTVYEWARAGKLPAMRLGPGAVRFDPDALESWLGGRTVGVRSPATPSVPASSNRVQRLHTAVSSRALAAMLAGKE